jgi:hypothetical protein
MNYDVDVHNESDILSWEASVMSSSRTAAFVLGARDPAKGKTGVGQFEHDLIRERTRAGLHAAAAHGRKGGRKPVVTAEKLKQAPGSHQSGPEPP